MDQTLLLFYAVLALGGVIGGNVLGAIVRGGGGVLGRSIIGAIGGVAIGFALPHVPDAAGVTETWSNLLPDSPANSAHLANLITGLIGGGVLGLVGGLLLRPRG